MGFNIFRRSAAISTSLSKKHEKSQHQKSPQKRQIKTAFQPNKMPFKTRRIKKLLKDFTRTLGNCFVSRVKILRIRHNVLR